MPQLGETTQHSGSNLTQPSKEKAQVPVYIGGRLPPVPAKLARLDKGFDWTYIGSITLLATKFFPRHLP